MGYAVYEDQDARDWGVTRWAGYAVPAECDMPDCHTKIDRGLGYKCEEHLSYKEHGTKEVVKEGCGLYFCSEHTYSKHKKVEPKPDTLEWRRWQLHHESWQQWRDDNPAIVEQIISELNGGNPDEERTLLFSLIDLGEDMFIVGNSMLLTHDADPKIFLNAGWVIAETHFPSFGDPRTDDIIAFIRSQYEEDL